MCENDRPLVVAQRGHRDRRNEAPVPADRAALEAPPPEAKRVDRHSGYPPGGEEVTAAAPHDRVENQEGTSPPGADDGLDADEHTGGHEAFAAQGRS